MMKKCDTAGSKFRCDSGQAVMELLMILAAMMLLIVGVVVLTAVEGAENAHLLRNKHNAEFAANSSSAIVVDSGEIGGWQRYDLELYRRSDRISIPFTAHDSRIGGGGSMDGMSRELSDASRSASGNYQYDFMRAEEFQRDSGRISRLAVDDAMHAARMVVHNSSTENSAANPDAAVAMGIRNMLSGVFSLLFSKMPEPSENITNRVYMPLQQP